MPAQGADILAHFGEDKFLERYQRYTAHIAEWRQQYPKLASVDLRYQQQVVLEMTPGAGGAQTTTDDGKAIAGAGDDGANGNAKPAAGMKADPVSRRPAHKIPPKPKAGKRHAAVAEKRTAEDGDRG